MDHTLETLSIVIAGHVDHGKSTLIGRLLYETKSLPESIIEEIEAISEELGEKMQFAYLLDALEEERAQNITIDTTQIFFKTESRSYIIIDAPGHKEFLSNMVTGASAAQAAILIVDAAQGVQEQTRRHAFLLSLLGLKQVIIVVNKMDLVGYREDIFDQIAAEIHSFLGEVGIEPYSILPISAAKGDNISERSEHLAWHDGPTVLGSLNALTVPPSDVEKSMRFSVQGTYTNDGVAIAVGVTHSGRVVEGEEVIVLPGRERRRIQSIEVWQGDRKEAEAGACVGVTLDEGKPLERGQVLVTGEVPAVVEECQTDILWMAAEPLKVGEIVDFQCSTQRVPCQMLRIESKINSSSLAPIIGDEQFLRETEVALVTLSMEKPVIAELFRVLGELGRFVLVRNDVTVAGGVVRSLG